MEQNSYILHLYVVFVMETGITFKVTCLFQHFVSGLKRERKLDSNGCSNRIKPCDIIKHQNGS